MANGLQTFLRMANLYNPEQMGEDSMPTQLPVGPRQPQLINRQGPSISTPGAYQQDTPWGNIDEEVQVGVEPEPMSTLEAFRQNVLNPPQRQHMTYPKNTLAGLTEALKIAATPTDYEKNRVFVDGQAHQQVKAIKDPATGQIRYINKYKQPGFMEQVMKAMPAAVSPAVDILNQPYEDAVADWELKNKGFKEAAGAESAMALAQQRTAQAGAIPVTAGARMMDAQTRARLAQLRDLPDSEKIRLLQEGKVSLEELRQAGQLTLEDKRQTGRVELEGTRQIGRERLEGIKQSGRVSLEEIKSANDTELEELRQSGRLDLESARQVNREILVRQRGEESRKTKATPSPASGATSQLPTQQKVAMQAKAQQAINENPEWADYISFNEQGFPVITMPDTSWGPGTNPADVQMYNDMYQAIYGQARPGAAPVTPPATQQATTPAAKPPAKAPGSSKMPPAKYKAAPGSPTVVPMITPDGKGVRMVPENQVQTALGQGYKHKTAGK